MGHNKAEISFSSFNQIFNGVLLLLDLFHQLYGVLNNVLRLNIFLFEKIFFKLFIIASNNIQILCIFINSYFLIRHFHQEFLLLLSVLLNPINFEYHHILIDNRLIDSKEFSFELFIILIRRLHFLSDIVNFTIHFLLIEFRVLRGKEITQDLILH